MITRSVKRIHDSNGDSKFGGLQFSDVFIKKLNCDMSQLLLLGKSEYGGGPIFKVVLEC